MIAWNESFSYLGKFSPLEKMVTNPPEWLVENMLPVGILDLFAQSQVGKSFTAIDLAVSLASGQSFLGNETTARPVIYICAENYADTNLRLIAAAEHRGGNGGIVAIVDAAPRLDTKEGQDFLAGAIEGFTRNSKRQINFRDCLKNLPKEQEREYYRLAKEAYERTDADDREALESEAMQFMHHAKVVSYGKAFVAGLDSVPSIDWHREQVNPDTGEVFTWHSFYGGRPPLVILDTKTAMIESTGEIPSSLLNKCMATMRAEYGTPFLTLSHEARSSGDYLGSVNSETDVDCRMRLIERGNVRILHCKKVRSGPKFADIHMTIDLHTIKGVTKPDGTSYTTLVCNLVPSPATATNVAPVAVKPTASGMLLELVRGHGGTIGRSDLRAKFYDLPSQKPKAQAAKAAAFRRAINDLADECLIVVAEDDGIASVDQRDITPTVPK